MFRDRTDAGQRLAEVVAGRLLECSLQSEVAGGLVLGLPRGGVPVAAPVAVRLGVRLDVLVIRKLGVPWQPELALGAVGEGGSVVLNDDVVSASGVGQDELDTLILKASHELEGVVADLRRAAGPADVTGRMVIVVDDGVATGATVRVASDVLRRAGSGPLVLATPVATASVCEHLKASFDEVICLQTPPRFGSVGQHYQDFEQVSLGQVRALLERWRS